jgi:hypothetical protein
MSNAIFSMSYDTEQSVGKMENTFDAAFCSRPSIQSVRYKFYVFTYMYITYTQSGAYV